MEIAARATIPPKPFPAGLRFLEPAPPAAAALSDPAAIQRDYLRWRGRVLFFSLAGYATFYLVRKNLPIAMPFLEQDLHISKTDLGRFLTLHGVLYGISKFANGFFGDRCNARAFMVLGLIGSAVMNLFFGFGSAVAMLGVVWMLNGWFQGMGFPSCARLLTHWFPPKRLATKMSIWNMSHCLGAIVILLLAGYLAPHDWRLCFFVPAAISFGVVIFLWFGLADTPPSVGLPEVEGTQDQLQARDSREDFKRLLLEHVFRNPYIWLIAIANFFVYTLRYAVFDWGPTLIKETKHIEIRHAAWMLAGFELSGAIGALLGGWVTDRFFGGRAMRACVFFMVLAGVSIFAVLENRGRIEGTEYCAALLRRLFHLRPAVFSGHRCGQPRHQTRCGDRRWAHRLFRLSEHSALRLGLRRVGERQWLGRGVRRTAGCRRDRDPGVRGGVAGQSAWLQNASLSKLIFCAQIKPPRAHSTAPQEPMRRHAAQDDDRGSQRHLAVS
jgi:OPA family glycerol-3-phosphate transporter-like MFS transporter/OPA family sugar phosphate sensor protein UhpC-like MFS transporter